MVRARGLCKHRRRRLSRALAFALLLAGVLPAAAEPAPADPGVLILVTETGGFQLAVEVADTPAARRQGLQGRPKLAENAGMLFDFRTPQRVAMWMLNTYIPLDMLFLDDDGRVVAIAKNTVPLSLDRIGIEDPVRAVLEMQAGVVDRLNVRAGDRVCHPIYPRNAC
ncbi:MAG: DUF192 domain-containing protein [Defluviicoccus sp.]